MLIKLAENNNNLLVLCLREIQNSIEDSVYRLLKNIIETRGVENQYIINKTEIIHKTTKSRFIFKGLYRNINSIKSLEGVDIAWIEEAQTVTRESLDLLIPTIRKKGSEIWFTFNPYKVDDPVYSDYVLQDQDRSITKRINYSDNQFFPDELREEMEEMKRKNHAKYLHIWEGELMQEVEGALWSSDMIGYLTAEERQGLINNNFEDLERIVISVDPATTDKATSDACGIIVVGKYINQDRYVVIEELSRISSPNQWSDIAIKAYDKYKADRIVAETNQGGDMVETIIKNKRRDIAYKGVHASRGKIARAEPIAALYEEGKVIHIDRMSGLEFEMVTYTGERNQKSPNSLDALVWGLSELSSRTKRGSNNLTMRF